MVMMYKADNISLFVKTMLLYTSLCVVGQLVRAIDFYNSNTFDDDCYNFMN